MATILQMNDGCSTRVNLDQVWFFRETGRYLGRPGLWIEFVFGQAPDENMGVGLHYEEEIDRIHDLDRLESLSERFESLED